ncbi:hypothetical protein [Armatimonas sp.]|uniref:hypothetical protein n=1 Tax=Armatimonas sp. TaxID=1872638 RepID=UPI00286CD498|nr:hypothetical protein [Armatimonas sp.]
MQWIDEQSDLEALLQEEQAIVLLYVGWSGYSIRVHQKLEVHFQVLPKVPIFVLNEETALLIPWRGKEIPETYPLGYGTIFWLQSGRVVDLLLQPYPSTVEELMERTHMAFALQRR